MSRSSENVFVLNFLVSETVMYYLLTLLIYWCLKARSGISLITKVALKEFLAQKYKDEHDNKNTSELDHDIIAGKKAAELACK